MTAATTPFDGLQGTYTVDEQRALWRGPREGWLALGALAVMLTTVGLAIDDANWAGHSIGGGHQTGFLPFGILLAGIVGLALAKSRLGALAAHTVGAAIGAAYLLNGAAAAISDAPSIQARFRALNESASLFVNDTLVLGIRSAETSAFLLTLGAIVWAAGQFAAFNVFRRGRPLTAILLSGLILLVNVALTVRPQYLHLILFSTAALLLLVRMSLFQQREGWLRRRIGDAGYVSWLFMRSGLTFVALALSGALVLASVASSAPLARVWRDADDRIVEVGVELNRWIGGVTGSARGPSNLFAPSQTIRGVWESSTEIVFRAATSDGQGQYWRAGTYDYFDGSTWQQLDREPRVVEPGEDLLGGTIDAVPSDAEGRRPVVATVTAVDLGGDLVLAPEAPVLADQQVEVMTNEPLGAFASARLVDELDSGESYTISSLVWNAEAEGGPTANELAAAGVDYPAWALRFVSIPPRAIGSRTRGDTERIVARLPAHKRNPYHIAEAIQNHLYRDGGFQYRTDVRGLCAGEPLVDCFLREKKGYCEYFATAMVMMLRTQSIPARYAMGYLPGRRLATGEWEVDRSAAHAWVEVYFPGYGWIKFDPTPGNRQNGQTPTRLEPGEPIVAPSPSPGASPGAPPVPRFSGDPRDDDALGAEDRPGAVPPVSGGGSQTDPAAFLAPAAVLLLVAAFAALALFTRRRDGGATEPELAYRGVATLASRFGYGPRPTQTAYEYAAVLSDLLPTVKPSLEVVARAKVEATYARRRPEAGAMEALRAAYRRARLGILRLALRRRRRSSGRR